MYRIEKLATAGLAAAILAFAVAACQPQEAARPVSDSAAPETAAPAGALTAAEVRELVVGSTVFGVDNKRKVEFAEYFAADGAAKLKANSLFGTFNYDGTYFFNDLDNFCTNYPAIPLGSKEFCKDVTPLGDGRYEQTDGIVWERILEGEQLDRLE